MVGLSLSFKSSAKNKGDDSVSKIVVEKQRC